jgi:hypothetical protein
MFQQNGSNRNTIQYNKIQYICSKMIMNSEFEMAWKNADVAYFKVLS